MPIDQISPPKLLLALEVIEAKGLHDTAQRARQKAGQVFRFGITQELCERDPSRDLHDALTTPVTTHRPAITEPDQVGELLNKLDRYTGTAVVKAALKLAPLTFIRPFELRKAEWSEIDFNAKLWVIPAERMKRKKNAKTDDHIVPLSNQAINVLNELYGHTGNRQYLFPNNGYCRQAKTPSPVMSENTVNQAMRRMGIAKDEMCGHGFRAMARTLLDEELGFDISWIEQQLAHTVADTLGRAYNRTKHLRQRTEMMQKWANYLDELKSGQRQDRFSAHTQPN